MLELNKIHQGDCVEGMKKLEDNSIDLVIADPPYRTTQSETKKKWGKQVKELSNIKSIANFEADWDKFTEKDYEEFTKEWIKEVYRVLRPKGTAFIHCILTGEFIGFPEIINSCKLNKFKLLNNISWCKPNGQPNLAGVRFSFSTEQIIWVGKEGKGKRTFNYQRLKSMNGGKQMRDYWIIPTKPTKFNHPSPKPIKLCRLLVEACSNQEDIVLDPFMGSGTTALACKQLNRNFIGFEINKEYIDIANKRLSQKTLNEVKPNSSHD